MAIVSLGGMGQMTPAQQQVIRKAAVGTARASGRKRSKGSKKKAVAGAVKRAVKRRAVSKVKKLVKGSAAAKAYMAKIRKMRK